MTNREAFGVYLRCQLEIGVQAVEKLSDFVFVAWAFANKEAAIREKINDALTFFWYTQGGRKYGKGVDCVVSWLGAEFDGDIDECRKIWSGSDSSWAEEITKGFGEIRGDSDAE